jgi:hypothetical protein
MYHVGLNSNDACVQVEGLLDRINGQPPVIQYIAEQFEQLGYASWAHRIINTASAPDRSECLVLLVSFLTDNMGCTFSLMTCKSRPRINSNVRLMPRSEIVHCACRFWSAKPPQAGLHGCLPLRGRSRCAAVSGETGIIMMVPDIYVPAEQSYAFRLPPPPGPDCKTLRLCFIMAWRSA